MRLFSGCCPRPSSPSNSIRLQERSASRLSSSPTTKDEEAAASLNKETASRRSSAASASSATASPPQENSPFTIQGSVRNNDLTPESTAQVNQLPSIKHSPWIKCFCLRSGLKMNISARELDEKFTPPKLVGLPPSAQLRFLQRALQTLKSSKQTDKCNKIKELVEGFKITLDVKITGSTALGNKPCTKVSDILKKFTFLDDDSDSKAGQSGEQTSTSELGQSGERASVENTDLPSSPTENAQALQSDAQPPTDAAASQTGTPASAEAGVGEEAANLDGSLTIAPAPSSSATSGDPLSQEGSEKTSLPRSRANSARLDHASSLQEDENRSADDSDQENQQKTVSPDDPSTSTSPTSTSAQSAPQDSDNDSSDGSEDGSEDGNEDGNSPLAGRKDSTVSIAWSYSGKKEGLEAGPGDTQNVNLSLSDTDTGGDDSSSLSGQAEPDPNGSVDANLVSNQDDFVPLSRSSSFTTSDVFNFGGHADQSANDAEQAEHPKQADPVSQPISFAPSTQPTTTEITSIPPEITLGSTIKFPQSSTEAQGSQYQRSRLSFVPPTEKSSKEVEVELPVSIMTNIRGSVARRAADLNTIIKETYPPDEEEEGSLSGAHGTALETKEYGERSTTYAYPIPEAKEGEGGLASKVEALRKIVAEVVAEKAMSLEAQVQVQVVEGVVMQVVVDAIADSTSRWKEEVLTSSEESISGSVNPDLAPPGQEGSEGLEVNSNQDEESPQRSSPTPPTGSSAPTSPNSQAASHTTSSTEAKGLESVWRKVNKGDKKWTQFFE